MSVHFHQYAMETESCQPSATVSKGEKSERYAVLVSRREALEARLQEKNDELKRLCIAEAELTGSLPPEIPLEPGEAVPTFRRRVGTSFALPENLINKLKSEEVREQSVSALELQFEVQSHITAAALQLANDCSGKKALRRQRRYEYQQNHRRLVELEARLNQLKLNQTASQKQRKKPRPLLDNESGGETTERDVPDSTSLSPNKSGNAFSSGYIDMLYPNNTMPHLRSHSYSYSHTHLQNNKLGKAQERLHATLSAPLSKHKPNAVESRSHGSQLQRLSSGSFLGQQQLQQQHYYPSYPSHSHSQLQRLSRHDRAVMPPQWQEYEQHAAHCYVDKIAHQVDNKLNRCSRNRFGSLDRKKHIALSSASVESRSVEGLDMMETQISDVISSNVINELLPLQVGTPQGSQSSHGSNTGSQDGSEMSRVMWHTTQSRIQQPFAETALLPGQTYPEHSLGHVVSPERNNLTRTQSLGSVDAPNPNHSANNDTRSIKDMYPSTSYTQQKNYDASMKKLKEKEWYESSLDTPSSSSHNSIKVPLRRPSGQLSIETKQQTIDANKNLSNSSCSLHKSALSDTPVHSPVGSSEYHYPHAKSETSSEHFDTLVPFESPKNHMVIEAGKWQPYWEVTKPFEMSDFYKYSTKFRKKTESGNEINSPCDNKQTVAVSPQQKGIYQPLQPLTCQPLDLQAAHSARNKAVSPSGSVDASSKNADVNSDDFSSEMLAWCQDQSSVPCSATLV